MHFDLISTRCGPFVSGCYFVFDNEFDLSGLQLREDKKNPAITKKKFVRSGFIQYGVRCRGGILAHQFRIDDRKSLPIFYPLLLRPRMNKTNPTSLHHLHLGHPGADPLNT